jgi:hypothetical protein
MVEASEEEGRAGGDSFLSCMIHICVNNNISLCMNFNLHIVIVHFYHYYYC